MTEVRVLKAAARRLHSYVLETHWTGEALVGPDPGIRWNARVGRFIKSYLRFLPWSDQMAYMQGQAYWILDNWMMAHWLGDSRFRDIAVSCTEFVTASQTPDGYWEYPNPEWKGRIATVEGCWATLGLLETYQHTGQPSLLDRAIAFYQFLVHKIGFRQQADEGMLAVNYFAHRDGHGGGVPNNAALALWMMAALANATKDTSFLTYCEPMIAWLEHVQLPSGELPYAVGPTPDRDKTHFLCYQYNAFQFIDLVHYYQLTHDRSAWPLMEGLASYLGTGITEQGAARFDCHRTTPEVTYYTSAVARAVRQATEMGQVDGRATADRAFARVLRQQSPHGGFRFYSRGNYGVLADRRSYPRYLAMILNHLLHEALGQDAAGRGVADQLVTNRT